LGGLKNHTINIGQQMIDKFDGLDGVYYIKLGRRGKWEKSCIEQDQTIRFGFNQAPHEACIAGDWEKVEHELRKAGYKKIADTRRQIENFYTSDEKVLWVTFYAGKLWWCFSQKDITLHDDGSKTRPVIGSWQSTDIIGKTLEMSRLSGKLLRVQRFQGTICNIKEREYLIQKITGAVRPEVTIARNAQLELEKSIQMIIKDLTPKDFEILVDLIFREAGWRRVSVLGESQKTLDLDLISPITGERYGIQIKSEASEKELEAFSRDIQGLHHERFYFVVHSPKKGLTLSKETDKVKLLFAERVAHLAVKYGLADWVIDKAG
jgi:hypothetical protein